ncbi:DUF29 domain-containing protein [Sulfurihydrogenibium azorense]|uniref:DUF29 domain-containing protein n=1 Tax=Sulfurihydrogenibium azorense TaxID=309806 RepID=UPI00240A3799|nr:DUF29 domain-containing protein [Sulfurihydrogenibium azorense]MDM7273183.1 DUF29 domain-containing protein [Sulfurihydrogenibium azorense]
MVEIKQDLKKLYEKDYYNWLIENIKLLKEKDFENLDIENLVQELEVVVRSIEKELISYMTRLLVHVYKWENYPNLRSKIWRISIITSQDKIKRLLEENPSLKSKIEKCLEDAWKDATGCIAEETDKDLEDLPLKSPYSFDEIMSFNPKKEDVAKWPYNL